MSFTEDQKQEIEKGIEAGLDVSVYARPEFLAIQMRQIRLGLEEKLPVDCYASAEFDWFQMEEIRKGLAAGIDVKKYASPDISFDKMRQIREGLLHGIDLSGLSRLPAGVLKQLRIAACENIDIRQYIREGYEEEQLQQIRIAKEKGLEIDPYITIAQRGSSMHEIVLGLEEGLPVSVYGREELNWQQMRELRLGLEERLDVTVYQKPLYSWQQMREIRLGLEEGLPVEDYSSLMYTAREMKKRRLHLLSEETGYQKNTAKKEEEYQDFLLYISEDWMEADVMLSGKEAKLRKEVVSAALGEKGVISGIDYQAIGRLEKEEAPDSVLTVARGSEPTRGKDGWYEYFFETDIKEKPTILEDGSVDYMNIKRFELVKKDQKIAYYHEAEMGMQGIRINGEKIPAQKGKDLMPLQGRGVTLLPDRRTYVAATDGRVELKNGRLEVTAVLLLENVTRATGNIDFNGSVYIRGTVEDGVTIKAARDIVVDGFVGAAFLEAGVDIVLRKGCNAGKKGMIQAGRTVAGNFFENATVIANEDVKANYCINSKITAERELLITGRFGSIVGGSVFAGVGILSYDIGNAAGCITKICAGKEENFEKRRTELLHRRKNVERELLLLNNAYRDFQWKFPPKARNTNPIYLKIEDAIYTKENEQKEINTEEKSLMLEMKQGSLAKIMVKGTLYPGVYVDINGAKWNADLTTNITMRKSDNRISLYRNN